eukprot:TRINITY_DN113231_c0_g1_i1.p1 TRINITY_DN113231_c0_g1~~TRINITY_DN113231_c0_g1_i1.p1  ORF type:complete len:103 (+),score=5.53 TRINITY_DN113231_c0_g1_i1:53-361(+)
MAVHSFQVARAYRRYCRATSQLARITRECDKSRMMRSMMAQEVRKTVSLVPEDVLTARVNAMRSSLNHICANILKEFAKDPSLAPHISVKDEIAVLQSSMTP